MVFLKIVNVAIEYEYIIRPFLILCDIRRDIYWEINCHIKCMSHILTALQPRKHYLVDQNYGDHQKYLFSKMQFTRGRDTELH